MRQREPTISNCKDGQEILCLDTSLTIYRCLYNSSRPKNKFVRVTHDDFYSTEIHQLTSAPARSQQTCAYDMDDVDLAWLNRVNAQRNAIGLSGASFEVSRHIRRASLTNLCLLLSAGFSKISELTFEQTMEELERQSWANMQTLLKTEEFVGIEYDENVICDVCRAVGFIPCSFAFEGRNCDDSFLIISRIRKKGTRWCFATVATSAFIKLATGFSVFRLGRGSASHALLGSARLANSVLIKVAR